MPEVLERLERPAHHRFDVDEYYKMTEAGILKRGQRVELIDGEIIDLNAIGSPHAAITNRLTRFFARLAVNETALLSVQNPLRLDAFNESVPDFMVLRPRADDYRTGHPSAADVLLLVEVSDSSLPYDRGPKLALYAKFGVPEVWIVDIAGAAIEIYRKPAEDGYSMTERRTGGSLSPALLAGADVDVAVLLA